MIKDLFTNKTIAVVGNAISLFDTSHGEEIDSHDIVMRINKGALICFGDVKPEIANSHGTQTDIWVLAKVSQELKQVYQSNRHHVPVVITTHSYESSVPDLYYACTENIEKLHKDFDARPSTGIRILDYIKDFGWKTLDVYGFDWKKTDTFYDQNRPREIHNYKKEQEYCRAVLANKHGYNFKE